MNPLVAVWLTRSVEVYAALGLLFALPFVAVGAARLDAAAARSTWGFRLLILPASAALWPWLAWRWWRGTGRPPVERNAHRRAAGEGMAG